MRSRMIGAVGSHRVSPVDFLQTHGGGDVAGANFLDFLALVGVHLHQMRPTRSFFP